MNVQMARAWAAALFMVLCVSTHAAPGEGVIQEVQELNEQARKLYDQGHYQQAMPLAQRAVDACEKTLGPGHLETASSLDTLAELYRATSDHARAEPLYRRALAIREKALGPEHPTVADSLSHLGALHHETSAYGKAESLYQRALEIRHKVLGPEHPTTASSLDNLALLYAETDAYAKAEPLYQRALAINEKALGPEHPTTARSLNNLALLYLNTGAYGKAESLNQRALEIRQKALGPEHPKTVQSLNNLGTVYLETGAYAKAEPLYQLALEIRQRVLGPEHANTAGSLNNLALLYSKTAAYAQAEPLYQRALAILEKVLGPEHPRTAGSLSNLALLYSKTGAYAKAEPLYQRAVSIFEKSLGPEHTRTAISLNDLAHLYSDTGAYDKAKSLHQRVLTIYEKTLGSSHPMIGQSLSDLANLYHDAGDYAKAEQLYQRALAIHQKTLGPESPHTGVASVNLGNLYSAMGAHAKAEALYQQAQAIQTKASERFLLTGAESRKQAYLQDIGSDTHRNVSFSISAPSRGSVALGLTGVLQYKGRVLDEMSGSVARLRESVKPADRELFEQLAEVASQFSTLLYQGLGNLSPEEYGQRLDELSQRQEALEADLAKRSAEFRRQVTPVTLAAVSRAIPAGAVLVEWFRYQPFDPKRTGRKAELAAPRYMAYVLESGGEPSLVDIGEAQVIETSVHKFLQALQDPTRGDVKEVARGLSDRIIRPLGGYLNGAGRVLISPDGILNLVPMAALLDENGEYLVNRFEMTYLTSGRDVLRMAAAPSSQNDAIVIADPDYGKPMRLLAAAKPLPQAQRAADLDRSGIAFRPLSNTAVEAQAIKALLKLEDSSVLTGLDATESSLKQLHGPRILHVASHGFFLNDRELAQLGPAAEQALYEGENPLLRAGIALAGANTRRSGMNDDGILTALEAAQLDLHGTELVVLSACESGVGQVQNGEGVYGLRRALFIAGAQTQVTSLWKVSDRATSTLMVDYYQRLLKGQGRSAALREAQRKMLMTPQRSHPYYWAGFVPIGNWSPLTAQP